MSWFLLFTTKSYAEAAIVKGGLEENEIPVQVLNKQDSIIAIGHYEVYVPVHLKEIAQSLLNNSLKN